MTSQASAGGSTSAKSPANRSRLLMLLAGVALGGATLFAVQQLQPFSRPDSQEEVPVVRTVTALGRLTPVGEVISLAAPTSSNESRIAQLLVQEGERVEAGQTIAVLDAQPRLQQALNQAQQDVRVAEAQLAQVLAGAQRGEIQAQRSEIARLEAEQVGQLNQQSATVARLEAEVQTAQTEYDRYEALYQEGAVSASERDTRELTLATAQRQLQEAQAAFNRIRTASQSQIRSARATLDQIAEVRPVDVEAARAEVARAVAARDQASASLEEASVRSPQDGTVLKIHTRAGEVVSSGTGIADIGRTSQMYAVAEVYQSDIGKVQVGQRARVTSSALPGAELMGTVETVGSLIERQEVINADPTDNIDSRVVEVYVRLDPQSSQQVENFTNLQVRVVIEL